MTQDTASISLGRETAIAFSGKVVLAALGFAGVVYFYRELGPATIGIYYTVLAGGKIASQVPGGFANAIHKRVSEVDTPTAEYFSFGLGVYLLAVALGLVVVALSPSVVYELVPTGEHLVGGFLIFASLGLFVLTNRVYAAIGNPGLSFWTDTVRSLLTLLAQLALVVLGYGEFGLIGGFVFATVVTGLGVGLLTRVRPSIPSRQTVARTFEFAKWSVPTSVTQNLYNRVDVLVIAFLVGSEAVGLYEPALRLTVPATFIAQSIGESLVVKVSGLHSLGDDIRSDLRNAVSYTSLFSIPIFFGALAIGRELMRTVYGPSAVAGTTALVGLALFQLLNTYTIPFDKVVNGVDRPQLQLYAGLLTLAIHLPLAFYLGAPSRLGLEGVVAATVVAEFARLVAYQLMARNLFGGWIVTRPVGEQLLSGLVMFGAVSLAVDAVAVRSWVTLVVHLGFGGVVYFGALVVVSRHFRGTVRNVAEDTLAGS